MTTSAALLLQQAGLTDFRRLGEAASPVVAASPVAAVGGVVMPPPAGLAAGGAAGGGGGSGKASLKRLSAGDVARHEASVVAFHGRIVSAIAAERASGRDDRALLDAMTSHLAAVEAALPRHLRVVGIASA